MAPESSVKQPRNIFFTKREEDEKCYVDSFDPLYAPLMWPLAFPDGAPPKLHAWDDRTAPACCQNGAMSDRSGEWAASERHLGDGAAIER